VVGYGGKTINTLRLWAAAAHDYFNFQEFSSGDFVGALAETLEAESVTRVLYPDDHTTAGQGLRFVQEYFLVACSLADLVRRFRKTNTDWRLLPEKVAIQLNDTHPTMAVPELMRILLDQAHLGWDEAWESLPREKPTGLHQSHAVAGSSGEMAARLVRAHAAASSGDHLRNQSPPD
jgi:Glucan phosphorylase